MNISFEEFRKIEIKIGKVVSCEKVENADKLLKLEVDFGSFSRQILSGIAEWYEAKEVSVCCKLRAEKIKRLGKCGNDTCG